MQETVPVCICCMVQLRENHSQREKIAQDSQHQGSLGRAKSVKGHFQSSRSSWLFKVFHLSNEGSREL